MAKENLLIDSGSTIKYSTEGPNIEDLELEEEDVIVNPSQKIEKYLKDIESKMGENFHLTNEKEKNISTNKPIKNKKISVFLKFGNPKRDFKLFGKLKKFHYVNKNFSHYFCIIMNVKTDAMMVFLENSINTQIVCNRISVDMDMGRKPSVFSSRKNTRKKNASSNWEIMEFVVGTSRGEYTQIKMKIS